ncbi:MAG TPA: agmatinase [Thermodesulfobacteriota bacterium]
MTDIQGPFDGVTTFMRVPFTRDLAGAKAAILGIPYDMGTHPTRIGARQGPAAIREQSSLVRPYQPPHADWNPLERLGVVDLGNVALTASRVEEAFARIEAAVSAVVEAGVVPVTLGGDGSVTLPQLRAVHRRYPGLAVLHLDAHTDTSPGEGYTTGTTFTRAAEEGVLDVAHTIHVGARGTLYQPGNWDHCRAKGYELIPAAELYERGVPQVTAHIRRRLAGRPVYLCIDMDFFDASAAPGVCAPTWGGPLPREGLALIQGLAGLDVVACDVNTVSPPHDVGGMTAFLAATVVLECLTLVACR